MRLVDSASNAGIAGIVRVYPGKGARPAKLPGLLERMRGLKVPEDIASWHVVPAEGAETSLPIGKIRIEALAGLETALTRQDFDAAENADLAVKLNFIARPDESNLAAGNTHLHLAKLSREQAEEYLRKIPPAERLRVLFISYLERNQDDRFYVTNHYPVGDLPQFKATGVLVNNGEEHRHNFQAYGQGYGHVMFLNIKKLVKPVSLGPGITGGGFDDRPLRPGIDEARQQGGTVIWCHNSFGFEDVVSALAGRLHALNIFDGSRSGTFEENYYRYLNLGMHLPISTGTDWFLYDFSRVYVRTPQKLTVAGWLAGLKAGRNFVSNGPLLKFNVAGKEPGDEIDLREPRTLQIEASAVGRQDFQRLQLVQNGKIIKTQTVASKEPYRAQILHQVRIDQPAWFALRIDSTTKNELDGTLYAHTSPVYVNFAGRSVFDVDSARVLLQQIEEAQSGIQSKGRFTGPEAREKVLALYQEAGAELRQRINKRR